MGHLERFAAALDSAGGGRRWSLRRRAAPTAAGHLPRRRLRRRQDPPAGQLWHARRRGPRRSARSSSFTNLVGALGFAQTVEALQGHRLLCIDEFELDDPGDTVLMSTLLTRLADAGVSLAATSNTLPGALGEGRFAADDFLREIQALSARFEVVTVDGEDYRHRGLAPSPQPLSDDEVAGRVRRRRAAPLDHFDDLLAHLATVHPSRYGALLDGVEPWAGRDVHPVTDQNVALRLVVLADRLYDADVPVFASGTAAGRPVHPGAAARRLPQEVLPGRLAADRAGPRGRRRSRARAGLVPRSPMARARRRRKIGGTANAGGKGKSREPRGKAARGTAAGRPRQRPRPPTSRTGRRDGVHRRAAGRAGLHPGRPRPRSTPGFSGGKAGAAALAASAGRAGRPAGAALRRVQGRRDSARSCSWCRGWTPPARAGSCATSSGSVDPQGVQLHRVQGARPREERAHPFLWRIRNALPQPGPDRRVRPLPLRGRADRPGARPGAPGHVVAPLRPDQRFEARPSSSRARRSSR